MRMSNFTQKAILHTFGSMLERMPFDKITVSALVKECGVSHNTFYYHYQDIYQLLDVWLREALTRYLQPNPETNWQENTKALLHACQEMPKTVYHIFNSISRDRLERFVFASTNDVFYQYVESQAEGKDVSQEQMQHVANVCRFSFFGYFLKFLWDNMEDDIDKSVDTLSDLFTGLVKQVIEHSDNEAKLS